MVKVDMGAPVPGDAPEGVYLADVASAKAKLSKAGSSMLELTFTASYAGGSFKVYDMVLLEGKGWSMGRAKLTALGIGSDFKGDLDPYSLIGRQVYLHLAFSEYQGRRSLKPDSKAGSHSGYSTPENPEARAKAKETEAAASAAVGEDETPF